ncbi:MAG: hypothetical protein ACTHNU_12355 [Gaiellales bacterium]
MRGWLVAGIACGFVLGTAQAAAAASWSQTSPEFFFPDFVGVGASSATNVWAVGENDADFSTPVAERWNGSAWVGGPTINVLRPNDGGLFGVSALSTSNAWAVGWQDTPNSGALALHWNGRSWSVVPTPVPAAGRTRVLNSVSAVSASNVWAVGGVTGPSGTFPLVEHWNGTAWKVVSAPGGGALTTVRVVTATNVWAAGGHLVEHYNGTAWSMVSAPVTATTQLSEINRVPGTTHLWAVGKDTGASPETPVAIYFNGTSWVAHNPPSTTGELDGVAADSGSNVWASGVSADGSANLTAHWTGTSWSIVSPAGLANGWVENMTRAPNSTQLFAVGSLLDGSGPFAAYDH